MTIFHLMRPQLKKAWPLVALQVTCLVGSALVSVGLAWVIQTTSDAIVASRWESVPPLLGPALGLIFAAALLGFGATAASGVFGSLVSRDLRSHTLRRMLGFPYAYYETHHSGDLVSRLTNDIARIQGFFENTLGAVLREPLIFLVASVWLWIIDPWLLAPTLVLTAVLVLYNLRQGPKVVGHYRHQQEGMGELTKAVQDVVQGVGIVKVYGLQQRMMEKIRRANQTIADHFLAVVAIGSRRSFVGAFCRYVPFLITLLWGGWRVLHGELSPGALVGFLYLYRYLNGALGYLPDLLTEVQGIQAVVDRVAALYEQPLERGDGSLTPPPAGAPLLEVRDLGFGYSPDQRVLQGLSFTVEAGQTVALVGTSGCGKSTLLKLLCGFDEPLSGELLLEGRPYRDWNLDRLRDHLALVSQETFLFPATVAENIGFGAPQATQEQIARVAGLAGAAEFIEALPEGYQTQVGERGVRLSGGQRQRLAIARALIKDAPLLLLDEPTSSLDAESESLVQAAIDRLMAGRTVIVAAHRLRTVRQAHLILVIEGGQIVERGTHDTLMAANGPYRRLYSKQLEGGLE